jgi:CRISPR-associated protein Csx17
MHTLTFKGCAPVPIAHYLKALGILRLVSEQCDADAVGRWDGDTFELISALDCEALVKFFLEAYKPTPIIAPWNGGSGFYLREEKSKEKDPTTGKQIKTGKRNQETAATRIVGGMRSTNALRFARYVKCINAARDILDELRLESAPKEEDKAGLLTALRNGLPDHFVEVLDAAFVLLKDGAKPPPLLGTGLNDGALDFSSNFMQRVTDLFEIETGAPSKDSEKWLRAALFNLPIQGLTSKAIGQFHPGASGGANSSTGFNADPTLNPWDFVLMLEGAMLFAGATVKRLQSADAGQIVYPFCVTQAGIGYGSAAFADEDHKRPYEMWLPLWEQPTGLSELKALLSEGRAQVGGRAARNGVDFARAVATLGVDRGISAFQRYGFQVRNGLAYFATPLERVVVRHNLLASQLLAPIDSWLDQFRRKARAERAPSSVQRAARALEAAIIAFCKTADAARVQELLISLGECEIAMARSWKWTRETYLSPVPLLAPRWLREANTGIVEFRLAAALAGLNGRRDRTTLWLRSHLEPVHAAGGHEKRWFEWADTGRTDVVWREGDLAQNLNAIFARRLLFAEKKGEEGYFDSSKIAARPADIAAFIEGRTDDCLLTRLLWALVLVDFAADYSDDFKIGFPSERQEPPALYALLKLCFSRYELRGVRVPFVPAIHRRARAGDGVAASMLAARRLRASGLAPAIECIPALGPLVARTAAALLFPLTEDDLGGLAERILRLTESEPQQITTSL